MTGPRSDASHSGDQSRWWRLGYPLTLTAVVALAAALMWLGTSVILSNTDGTLIRTVDDPLQPGFEALVEPTEMMLVPVAGLDGELASVAALSVVGPGAGAVIVISPQTTLAPVSPDQTLAQAWLDGGAQAVAVGAETILNAAATDVRLIDAQQWASLLEPVGPLVINNPDTLVASVVALSTNVADGDEDPDEGPAGVSEGANAGPVTFDVGVLELDPNEVAAYLGASVPGESDLNRMFRQQLVWAAWLEAVGGALDNPGVVPGETGTGLGYFVRTLAAAEVELAALPVEPQPDPASGATRFVPLNNDVAAMVSRLIPFPVGASPQSRQRIRILDGTGKLANGLPAAPPLVKAGAEVATVGNAKAFDYRVTQFIVSPDARPEAVTQIVEAFRPQSPVAGQGAPVGEVVATGDSGSAIDVTVILGEDVVAVLGGPVG